MSKVVQGVVELGAAVGLGALAFIDPAVMMMPAYWKITFAVGMAGVGSLISAAAQAITGTSGTNITTQQAAGFRTICYGERQVPGMMIYQSTTGSKHDQDNSMIVVCGHPIHAFVSLYLDGRLVQWVAGSPDNKTFGGISFGGNAGGGTLIGPTGAHYNFDTLCFADAYDGTQSTSTYSTALQANDPTWAPSTYGTPSCSGCACTYLKIEYDSAMFPSRPQIRWVIQGKNDIFDPRTGTRGYTTNWALIVADVLTNTDFGLGVAQSSINTAQLIAAANVCDELVACAVGEEARYSCNWTGDTSSATGEILSQMLPAAAGRITYAGGQWYLWPAYWQGPTSTWDQSSIVDTINWSSTRKFRDLFNRVSGSYTAPWYPYNVSGNLYDRNGWYDGTTADTYPLAWQPTSFPTYAQDTLHGYSSDQWLLEDGGKIMYKDLGLAAVLSVSQAQRLAKIELLRNRWQGSGTLQMSLAAYQMMPVDVTEVSFPLLGWNNKVLEVTNVRLVPQVNEGSDGPSSMRVTTQVDVQESDPSVYEWSEEEELTIQSTPVLTNTVQYSPAPPTAVTLSSSAATAVTSIEGMVQPRVLVSWDSPLDNMSKLIGIEYQLAGASTWIDAPSVPTDAFSTLVSGVTAGQTYNFRVRSLRANGAPSVWVEIDGYLVSSTIYSVFTTSSGFNNLGWTATQAIVINYTTTNSGVTFSWAAQSMQFADGSTLAIPAGTLAYTGLSSSTAYYTYWYVNATTGALGVTNPNPPPTSPSSLLASETSLNGRITIPAISFTTLASGNTGIGGGTGGGGDVCPEANELVEIQRKGNVKAGEVMVGDLIKGKSFHGDVDVYRKVTQVHGKETSTWRIVEGHKVSPCEPVYIDGQWMPAYRAPGATIDATLGRKMFISVASDEYDEQNFYLVGGTALLIHNFAPVSPC